jgi:hypothetical protein
LRILQVDYPRDELPGNGQFEIFLRQLDWDGESQFLPDGRIKPIDDFDRGKDVLPSVQRNIHNTDSVHLSDQQTYFDRPWFGRCQRAAFGHRDRGARRRFDRHRLEVSGQRATPLELLAANRSRRQADRVLEV